MQCECLGIGGRRPGLLARYMKVPICINEFFIEIISFQMLIWLCYMFATASYAPVILI